LGIDKREIHTTSNLHHRNKLAVVAANALASPLRAKRIAPDGDLPSGAVMCTKRIPADHAVLRVLHMSLLRKKNRHQDVSIIFLNDKRWPGGHWLTHLM
jgi:hypothetical protein